MALRDMFGDVGCDPSGGGSSTSSSSSAVRVRNPIGQFFNNAFYSQPSEMATHLRSEHAKEKEEMTFEEFQAIDNANLAEFGQPEESPSLDLNINWDSFWQDFGNPLPQFAEATEPPAYEFTRDNPYLEQENPFNEGVNMFHKGRLQEAILAFEAQLQQNAEVNRSDVWRWLGSAHAENDDDKLAISCLLNAVQADPENLEALLDIGVSYTNELVALQALNYLTSWLRQHPDYQGIPDQFPTEEPGFFHEHQRVTAMFHRASEIVSDDPDVHAVLGVLYNLSRDYELAIESFKKAIALDPKNYSLWNKLGATQANSPRLTGSKEAVYAYRKALELKPNYVRAWVNMGISYANQGVYDTASKYYLRALSLNPSAEHIWSYLRISLSCMNRPDLVELVDRPDKNFNDFRKFFEF